MENVNIQSIEFDKSMPLWATEQSIQKINKLLTSETRLSRKELNKLNRILGTVSQTLNKSTKDQSKHYKDNENVLKQVLGELVNINKELKNSNKQSSNSTKPSSPKPNQNQPNQKSDGKLSNNVQQQIKSDINIRMNKSLTEQFKFIHKAVNKHTSILKQVSQRFDVTLTKLEKQNTKTTGALERMVGIVAKIQKDGIKTVGSSEKTQTKKSDHVKNLTDKEESPSLGIMDQIYNKISRNKEEKDIFRPRSRINERGNVFQGRKRKTRSVVKERGENPMVKMFNKLSKSMRPLIKSVGLAGKILSKFATILNGTVLAAKLFYNITDDITKQRRKMLQQGFSFGREGEDFNSNKLRTMINSAGVSIERGLKSMEKNATLINKIGVESFIETLGELTADGGLGSLMGDLGLQIEEIDDYASQYMSTLQRLGDSERLREENRAKATERFIREADQMGKVTGMGTKAILDNVLKIQQTAEYRAAMIGMDDDQRKNMESLTSALTALSGGNEELAMQFSLASTDPTGQGLRGTEQGQKLGEVMSMIGMEDLFTKFDSLVSSGKDLSAKEQAEQLKTITKDIQARFANLSESDGQLLRTQLREDDKLKGVASLIFNIADYADLDQITATTEEDVEEGKAKRNLDEVEATQTGKEAAMESRQAAKEKLESEAAEATRETIFANTNKAAIKANELLEDAANGASNWLQSLIGSIKSVSKWFGNLIDTIGSFIGKIASWIPGIDAPDMESKDNKDDKSDKEVIDRESENLGEKITRLSQTYAGSEQYQEVLDNLKNVEGEENQRKYLDDMESMLESGKNTDESTNNNVPRSDRPSSSSVDVRSSYVPPVNVREQNNNSRNEVEEQTRRNNQDNNQEVNNQSSEQSNTMIVKDSKNDVSKDTETPRLMAELLEATKLQTELMNRQLYEMGKKNPLNDAI